MKTSGKLFLGERPVAVFSHPNHEIAIFGILHTLNCPIIFLCDGGARQRIVHTTLALRVARHRAPVLCLHYSERSIYEAFARRDTAFFNSMAAELASRLSALRAGAIREIITYRGHFLPTMRELVQGKENARVRR